MQNNQNQKSSVSDNQAQQAKRSEKPPEKTTDKRKQSLYFPEEMLTDIKKEALRQDRSLSWIVQQAWRIAKDEIKRFPSINLDSDVVDE